MKTLTSLVLILLSSTRIFGQFSDIEWQKSLGGSLHEFTKEIENTLDGGFITIGYSESSDGNVLSGSIGGDWWIVKTNSLGIIEWEKSFGGTGFDFGYTIKQTVDGGYIAGGYSESNDGDVAGNHGAGDCWIIKLNSTGTIEWQKTFGGTLKDYTQTIKQTPDSGYIVVGYSESSDGDVASNHGLGDCWIFKLDNSGKMVWENSIGGSSFDYGQDIKQTDDGGYILCGGTNSNDGDVIEQKGNGDCWLLKLDAIGNILWQKSFGGSQYDIGQSIELTTDEGYIIAGYTESNDGDVSGNHGGGDAWVIKCDPFGTLQWQKSLGSSGNDYAFSILNLTTGGYALTGYSEFNDGDVSGNHGNYDCWLVKLDGQGEVNAQKSIGGSLVDIGYSIRETLTGSIIVAGFTESNDGNVSGNHGGGDAWIIKFSESTLGIENNEYQNRIKVSPNPSLGNLNFSGLEDSNTIEIYNTIGEIVFQTKVEGNNYNLNMCNETKGIYFYRIHMKNGSSNKGKIILY